MLYGAQIVPLKRFIYKFGGRQLRLPRDTIQYRAKILPREVSTSIFYQGVGTRGFVNRSGHASGLGGKDNAPAWVNWESKGAVSRVKRQRKWRTFWAFTSVGAYASLLYIKKKTRLLDLSAQQVIDFSRAGNAIEGGNPGSALRWIAENGGVAPDWFYPYVGHNHTPGDLHALNKYNIPGLTGCYTFKNVNEILLKKLVSQQPVIVSVYIGKDTPNFNNYEKGVYDTDSVYATNVYDTEVGLPDINNHVMLLTGYGKFEGRDVWIVRNSYGVGWGIDGNIYMARNAGGRSGILGLYRDVWVPVI